MVSQRVVLQQGNHILDSIFGREQRDQLYLPCYKLQTAWTGYRTEIQAKRKKYSIILNSKFILKSVKLVRFHFSVSDLTKQLPIN